MLIRPTGQAEKTVARLPLIHRLEELCSGGERNVRGKGKRSNVTDRLHSVEEAEDLTGITKMHVSRWAKRLANRDAYRERL
jgi:hypothetical protein